jgi:hypothetical protein
LACSKASNTVLGCVVVAGLPPLEDEHQAFASLLGLNNPFNMLDVDFNKEEDFYDWVASHLYIHQQIAAALNLSS